MTASASPGPSGLRLRVSQGQARGTGGDGTSRPRGDRRLEHRHASLKVIAARFHAANPAVTVDVAESGTGGGFRKFCAGQTDIEDASRPINATGTADCKAHGVDFVELPVGFDSLSVVVNPKNTFVDCLTTAELKTMWEPAADGKVTSWKQIRAAPLKPVGPGHDSGTFDYFALAIVGIESQSRKSTTSAMPTTRRTRTS
jgi:phosphate transport system substrate-binding protein